MTLQQLALLVVFGCSLGKSERSSRWKVGLVAIKEIGNRGDLKLQPLLVS